MDKQNLKVIKGGKGKSSFYEYTYIEGEVTDTRLMGVVGLHLHWKSTYDIDQPHLHQYYYYDVEELALDTYRSYDGNDPSSVQTLEKKLLVVLVQ